MFNCKIKYNDTNVNIEFPCTNLTLFEKLADLHVLDEEKSKMDIYREQGIPEHIIVALKLLTHDESIPYLDYIKLIKENDIAQAVKIADLKHNSDLTRLDEIGEKDMARVGKYKQAIRTLER